MEEYKTAMDIATSSGVTVNAVYKRLQARIRQGRAEGILKIKNGKRTIWLIKVDLIHTVAAGPKTGRPRKEKS